MDLEENQDVPRSAPLQFLEILELLASLDHRDFLETLDKAVDLAPMDLLAHRVLLDHLDPKDHLERLAPPDSLDSLDHKESEVSVRNTARWTVECSSRTAHEDDFGRRFEFFRVLFAAVFRVLVLFSVFASSCLLGYRRHGRDRAALWFPSTSGDFSAVDPLPDQLFLRAVESHLRRCPRLSPSGAIRDDALSPSACHYVTRCSLH